MNNTTYPVQQIPEQENRVSANATVDTELQKQSKATEVKSNLVKNGKASVVNFIIKKIFMCILSAILSAAMVLYTQFTIKDDFKDYYYDVLNPLTVKTNGILSVIGDAFKEGVAYEDIKKVFNDTELGNQANRLLKEAHSYSSNNDEINHIHNLYIDVCEEIVEITSIAFCIPYYHDNIDYSQIFSKFLIIMTKVDIFSEACKKLCDKYDIKVENGKIL